MTSRLGPITLILLAVALPVQARQTAPAAAGQGSAPSASAASRPPAPAPPTAVPDELGAQETRERLKQVLAQYPPSVRQVLRIDPSLLSRADYLVTYPALWAFLQQHPEVLHNPSYFIGSASGSELTDSTPPDARIEAIRSWRSLAGFALVVANVFIITSALVGVIRTLIDQRRWTRAARMQIDMQNKVIDRFSSSNELLAYLQSPPGRDLAAVHAPALASGTRLDMPLGRIFWPLQAGIVLAAAGIGLMFVGSRVRLDEIGQPMWGIGIVAIAVGAGFVSSAVVSYIVSHRLGLISHRDPGLDREVPNV